MKNSLKVLVEDRLWARKELKDNHTGANPSSLHDRDVIFEDRQPHKKKG